MKVNFYLGYDNDNLRKHYKKNKNAYWMPEKELHPLKELDRAKSLFKICSDGEDMNIYTHSEIIRLYFMSHWMDKGYGNELKDLKIYILNALGKECEVHLIYYPENPYKVRLSCIPEGLKEVINIYDVRIKLLMGKEL